MIKVDANTVYMDFQLWEPLMADGMAEAIERGAVRDKFGEDGFWSMTLGDMFAVMAGDTKPLTGDRPETVFSVYRAKAFAKFVDDLIGKLKVLTLPPTPESIRHSQGCLDYAFDESVYVFCLHYFGLHSFAEVEALKVADLLMAKKDAYNQQLIDRNMAADIKKGAKA